MKNIFLSHFRFIISFKLQKQINTKMLFLDTKLFLKLKLKEIENKVDGRFQRKKKSKIL